MNNETIGISAELAIADTFDVENVEFGKYINLMPASKYKGKELYRYVESIHKVEDNFDDACIGDSLTVATMSKTAATFNSFEELEMCKFDERFKKFYEKNSNMVAPFKYIYIYRQGCKTIKEVQEAISNINKDISFSFTIFLRYSLSMSLYPLSSAMIGKMPSSSSIFFPIAFTCSTPSSMS